jgi:hypothetical protein
MHTLGQATAFIEKVFGQYKITKQGLDVEVACPICAEKGEKPEKKKLSIKLDNWWVHCWKCNYKSRTLFFLLKKYRPEFLDEYVNEFYSGIIPYQSEDELEVKEETSVELPDGFTLLAEQFDSPKTILAMEIKKYLLFRGATLRDIWYFKYGFTLTDKNFKYRVIIPSYDADGKLNYYTSRTIISSNNFKGRKYNDASAKKTNIIFNEINIDWTKELTIVEGPFDLLKCNENATCLLGSSLEKNSKLFQKIVENETPVLLALDNDAKEKQLNIAKDLSSYGINVRLYQIPKHLNDVGQMTKEEFINGIPNSRQYTLSNDLKFRIELL